MGIARIEWVTYLVEDLDECVRFYQDLGLTLSERSSTSATFTTLVGQRLHLETEAPVHCPPPVEDGPGIREIVWGVDTQGELDRLVAQVAKDRDVLRTEDGTHHFADVSGWGVGLTLAAPDESDPTAPRPFNTSGYVGRWNTALEPVGQVRPFRMCHVALNVEKHNADEAVAFYIDRLEFIATDVVKPMGVFMRCEGDADQHNFLLSHRPDRVGTNHVSYEVPSFDDVIEGGNHMIECGWREARRLGRHTVGSNVFRFVHSPSGGRVEYAFDMDRVDDTYGTRVHETTPPHHIWTMQTNRDPDATEG